MRAPTLALLCLTTAATGARAGDELPTLAPNVAGELLITDVQKDPHKPTLPRELDVPGHYFWGLYKITVTAGGEIADVKVVRSAAFLDEGPVPPAARGLDDSWIAAIKTWRYRPYQVNGKAVPFCYVHRVQFGKPKVDSHLANRFAAYGPKMLAPNVGTGQLAIDPKVPPHKLTLPPDRVGNGDTFWGLYKICVATSGEVVNVGMVKSAGERDIDDRWMAVIRGWRYRPYLIQGQPVPFCYTLRLQVTAQ